MSSHLPSRVRVEDPFAAALRAANGDGAWLTFALVVAACAHGVVAFRISGLSRGQPVATTTTPLEMVEIDLPTPPAPAPMEPPKAEEPARPAPAFKSPAAPREVSTGTPPPAAAAQAGAVLTAPSDPNDPVDLTNSFVSGSAATYAGGATLANGTSSGVVRGRPAPSGAPTGTSTAAPTRIPTGPDLSRPPKLEGRSDWKCPFPPEADQQQVDHAVVALKVGVDATGRVTSVAVVSDAGHGFGREARGCAMGRRWAPAVDHDGSPAPGSVTINVRFDR